MTTGMQPRGRSTRGSLAGFLAAAFCVVGLAGLFASYAAPLAYQREMQREATLDTVLRTPAAQLPALRDQLGDSADAVLAGTGSLAARVQAERTAMRARFAHEEAATEARLRLLLVIVTLMSAAFGATTVFLRGA